MFTLTETHLWELWKLNNFPVPRDWWVFFGLRGCVPVNDAAPAFAASHAVRVAPVDYLHPRCTLGTMAAGGRLRAVPGQHRASPHERGRLASGRRRRHEPAHDGLLRRLPKRSAQSREQDRTRRFSTGQQAAHPADQRRPRFRCRRPSGVRAAVRQSPRGMESGRRPRGLRQRRLPGGSGVSAVREA